MKLPFTVFFSLLICAYTYAQTLSIKGKIVLENEILPGATALLYHGKDTLQMAGTVTNNNGVFLFENLSPGFYKVKVSYLGMETLVLKTKLDSSNKDFGSVQMKAAVNVLNMVKVTQKASIADQKGDTLQINASSFKTNPDATAEELISKMPGVTNQEGKLQAQGEEVKKVLVDGKPFLGDDPNAVLKSLPADIIDKIQIFDKKSDQAAFTGMEDGNNTKTINIITKASFKNGTFGKIYAGYGDSLRYKTGGNINFFKNDRRFSVVSQSNNINEQNFSAEDLLGVIASSQNSRGQGSRGSGAQGGGGNRGQGNGGRNRGLTTNDASDFLVDQKNGINTTHAIGLNYNDKWGKNTLIACSYYYNATNNLSLGNLYRTYYTQDISNNFYRELNNNNTANQNHRLQLRLEQKIDSLNSLLVQFKGSLQVNDGKSLSHSETQINNQLTTASSNLFNSQLTGSNYSIYTLWRHKFRKQGRTFSFSVNPGYSSASGTTNLTSGLTYFRYNAVTDTINQEGFLNKYGYTQTSTATFTEPLAPNHYLEFTTTNTLTKSNSKKETYTTLSATGNPDSLLSNVFNNNYNSTNFNTGYRYQNPQVQASAGLSVQQVHLFNTQTYPYSFNNNRHFTSILPNAQLRLTLSTKSNLRLIYRTKNNPPSIDQLQEVVNNSNPLQLSTGNTNLKQDFNHSITLRYNYTNNSKGETFFAMAGYNNTYNYIGSNTIIANKDTLVLTKLALNKGAQITVPVNLSGYYNLRSFVSYGYYWGTLKTNINLNAGVNFTQTPNQINNAINSSKNLSYNAGLTLSSNISSRLDFSLTGFSTYSQITNAISTSSNSIYYYHSFRGKVNWIFYKTFYLNLEVNEQINQGLSNTFNQTYTLLNGAIGCKFLKENAADVRLSVFDALQQNNSVSRNAYETYYEDNQTNVLQRYIMITFTYNLKQFKSEVNKEETKQGDK